jgi:hypothetical protein
LEKIKQKGIPLSSLAFGLLAQPLSLISLRRLLPSSLSVRPAWSPPHRVDGPACAGAQLHPPRSRPYPSYWAGPTTERNALSSLRRPPRCVSLPPQARV